jgi:hypothetical protein
MKTSHGIPQQFAKNCASGLLMQAKHRRAEAQRKAFAIDPNAGFRLTLSDKLAEAAAKRSKVDVRAWKAAHAWRAKRQAG